jgi:hypothetical protein
MRLQIFEYQLLAPVPDGSRVHLGLGIETMQLANLGKQESQSFATSSFSSVGHTQIGWA